jgi:hypothetical protein
MGTSATKYICWVAYLLDPGILLVPRRSRKCANQQMVVFYGSAMVQSYLHDRAEFVGLLDVQLQTHISLVVLSRMEEAGGVLEGIPAFSVSSGRKIMSLLPS